ncbi:TPA: GNAT family N-acetyltransferase [Salmonella enterica]
MRTVGRLFRADIRTDDFANYVGVGPRADRLGKYLKDPSYSVYVVRNAQARWVGYLVATYQHGDPTLTCHYFEEFEAGALDAVGLALILDHTGFEFMACPAPNDDIEKQLISRGFVLADLMWSCSSRLFDGVITASEIQFVSGECYNELPAADKECIRELVSGGIYEELHQDVRGHYLYTAPIADTMINRIPHANVETAVWRDGKEIVGVAQMRLVSKGVVMLTGVAVKYTHQGKGIGRRLIGSLFKFAQRYSDTVYIETGANNGAANHLYGNILRCTQVVRSMILKRNSELVSWKKAKGNRVELMLREKPRVAEAEQPPQTSTKAFLLGLRG